MKKLFIILKYGFSKRVLPPGMNYIVPVRVPPISLKDAVLVKPAVNNSLPQADGVLELLKAMELCRLPKKNVDAISPRTTYGFLQARWPSWFAITLAHLVLVLGIVTSALWFKQSTKNETAAINHASLVLSPLNTNQPLQLVAEDRQPKVLGKIIVASRVNYSGRLFGNEGKAAGGKVFNVFIYKIHPFANGHKISASNTGRTLRFASWGKIKNLPQRLGLPEIKQGLSEVIKAAPLQIKLAARQAAEKTAGKMYAVALHMQKPVYVISESTEVYQYSNASLSKEENQPDVKVKTAPNKNFESSGSVLGETISAVDPNTINQLIDQRLNQYLSQGKFKGEKGDKGEKGETGPMGPAGSTLQGSGGTGWTYSYVNAGNPGGQGNGTIGSFTYFSSDKTLINVLNVTDQINVSGPATFTGTVTFATTTLNGIAYTWPSGVGTSGQVLSSNGLGQLSWVDISVAGATWSTSTNGTIYYTGGNVGIGTSSPGNLLHIYRSADDSVPELLVHSITTSTSADYLKYAIVGKADGANASWSRGYGVVGLADAAQFHKAVGVYAALDLTLPGAISFDSALYADGKSLGHAGIFLNGNVGIGTSAPTSVLYVQGNASNPSYNLLSVASSTGTQLFTVTPSGNVGVGTSGPAALLDITGAASTLNSIRMSSIRHDNAIDFYSQTGSSVAYQQAQIRAYRADTVNQTGLLTFSTNNAGVFSEKMRLQGDGNVGIGTTSPLAKLDVYGNLNVATSSTSVLFANTGTSRVGIGTSTPGDTLHILTTTSFGGLIVQSTNDVGVSIKSQAGNGAELKFPTQGVHLFARANSGNLFIGNSGGVVEMIGVNGSVSSPNSVVIGRQSAAQSIGNGTLLVYDATASTGITTLNIQEGAGQGATSTLNVLANNGTTTRLTVLGTSGNVGIGTGTPTATLHVQGSGSNNSFTISSSTGANLFTMYPTGNIGIGPVGTGNGLAPNSKIFITYADGSASAINNGLTLNNIAGQPGNFVGIRFGLYSGNDTAQKQFIGATMSSSGSGGTGDLVFMTITNGGSAYQQVSAADEKMRITHYGNVGIGTTGPTALLHVNSASSTQNLLAVTTSTNNSIFVLNPNGNVGIGTNNPLFQFHMLKSVSGGAGPTMLLENNMGQVNDEARIDGILNGGSSISNRIGFIRTNSPASTDTDMYFSTRGNAALGEKMRITSLGNVGIGTTSPLAKLDVYGNLNVATSSTPALTVNTATGRVGIGTASPGYALEVNGTARANYLYAVSGFYGGGIDAQYGSANVISFSTGGNEWMRINSGNVGIGTTSPGYPLVVNSNSGLNTGYGVIQLNITASSTEAGLSINNTQPGGRHYDIFSSAAVGGGVGNLVIGDIASSTSRLVISSTGNVGIGTTTPTLGPLTMSSGAYVTAGGTWTNASDRNIKENFASVTPASVLEKIVNLPIAKWNYKLENSAITHLGPTAQDFYAAFGLGGSDTSISTIDPSGVALVGIQALNEKLNTLQLTLNNLQNTGKDVASNTPIIIKTQLYLSKDSVGQAKILAGSKSVRVTFNQPYEYQPIVTVTLNFVDDLGTFVYGVAEKDAQGFTIKISRVQNEDVTFDWHAFASPEARLTVSDGSSEDVVLVVPQVAGVSVGTGDTEKENINNPPSTAGEDVAPSPSDSESLIPQSVSGSSTLQGDSETTTPSTSSGSTTPPATPEPAAEEPAPAAEEPTLTPTEVPVGEPAPVQTPPTEETVN